MHMMMMMLGVLYTLGRFCERVSCVNENGHRTVSALASSAHEIPSDAYFS